jgi:phage-related protein
MEIQWKVILYRSLAGDYPVQEFVNGLEIRTQSKVKDSIALLKEFGISLGLPHVKKLAGTELWELRILGSDSLRVLYIAMTGRVFVLLHGFKKKKNKISTKDIMIAQARLAELRSRVK